MKRLNFTDYILIFGLIFFYVPLITLVVYSFNASSLVTVWGGFSTKWYANLLDNKQLIGAVFRSLEVAFYSAISTLILGSLSAFVLARIPNFKGRKLFSNMVSAPLVMPEVITGLSLLLLFVMFDRMFDFKRGLFSIWIAHTTLGTAYATMIISSRMKELDKTIEEAAMDLGARPWKVFLFITIPMITPSLGAAGMMAFSLSLDDLVLASFVTGPGATTLPIEIFSAIRLGVKPDVNAIASIILLIISFITFLAWFVLYKKSKERIT